LNSLNVATADFLSSFSQKSLETLLMAETPREFARHTLAATAYRASKALRDAPASFGSFRSDETSRTPAQILAHMGDLFDWALTMISGKPAWHNSEPLEWNSEVARFFASVQKFDAYLASDEEAHTSLEILFQGPIADALTHIGQLAMLRRLAGCRISGENYAKAKVVAGECGLEQGKPRLEF
jgi:hypothetical protein